MATPSGTTIVGNLLVENNLTLPNIPSAATVGTDVNGDIIASTNIAASSVALSTGATITSGGNSSNYGAFVKANELVVQSTTGSTDYSSMEPGHIYAIRSTVDAPSTIAVINSTNGYGFGLQGQGSVFGLVSLAGTSTSSTTGTTYPGVATSLITYDTSNNNLSIDNAISYTGSTTQSSVNALTGLVSGTTGTLGYTSSTSKTIGTISFNNINSVLNATITGVAKRTNNNVSDYFTYKIMMLIVNNTSITGYIGSTSYTSSLGTSFTTPTITITTTSTAITLAFSDNSIVSTESKWDLVGIPA